MATQKATIPGAGNPARTKSNKFTVATKILAPYRLLPLWLFLLCCLVLACNPVIETFSPDKGFPGDEVTITGQRFGDTAAENIVKFGAVEATERRMDTTGKKIICTVPPDALTGLISVTVAGKTGVSKKNFIVPTKAKWTFMIYLDADNNLESAGLADFLEMSAVGTTPDVNILVQMDRISSFDTGYGNWTGVRRFHVQKENTPATAPIMDLGELNMGDPAVLQDFVEWGITGYPAEHYALAIWNHGGGWRAVQDTLLRGVRAMKATGRDNESDRPVARAVAWDDTDGDMLYMREVQTALESARTRLTARNGTMVKLDIVGFDACLMGMIEVAYALRNVANFMVGSEELEPSNGWPYDTILQDMVNTPSISAGNVAKMIVDKYGSTSSSQITLSSVDLEKVNDVCLKIDNLTATMTGEWASLQAARNNATQYHVADRTNYWGVDLWDLADKVYTRVTATAIRSAANELKYSLNNFVTNERHSSDRAGSHGVAIYFPHTLSEFNNDTDHSGYEQSNTYMPVDFVLYHQWDNWLQNYYSHIP